MKYKNNIKKLAFTLSEIVIALAIVCILTIVTLPIINKQLDKTDEYAYYMAFKSVEKMASQIVIMGEEYKESTSNLPVESKLVKHQFSETLSANVKNFFNDISKRIAFSENSIIRKLFPKAFAEDKYVEFKNENTIFTTDDFIQQLWLAYRVCNGSTVEMTSVPIKDSLGNITGYKKTNYSKENFNNCYGYTLACAKGADCGSLIERDANGNPVKDKDGNTVSHKIEGPIEKNEILKNMLPTMDTFGLTSESSFNTLVQGLLSYIGYSSASSNNGNNLCTAIKNKVKANFTDNVTGNKYQNSIVFVAEDSASDDDDDDEDDGKEDSGAGFDVDSFIDYTSVSGRGSCVLKQTVWRKIGDSSSSSEVKVERPTFDDSWCRAAKGFYTGDLSDNGWMNGDTTHATLNCVPRAGYEVSENNAKVACKIASGNKQNYAKKTSSGSYNCVPCENDFNATTGACCPEHSIASGDGCACITGWKRPEGASQAAACSIRDKCPNGYSIDEENNICVLNPPIIRATRFAELIAKNWNINKKYYDDYGSKIEYTDVPGLSGAKYYKEVYEAALGRSTDTSNRLMSIDSKPGAFAFNFKSVTGLKPNVILANGQFIWIMSDRLASIPGLTYSTDNSDASRNICKNLNKKTKSACSAASSDAYFCGSENACYALSSKSIKDGTSGGMGDARNCCASPDLSDIAAAMSSGSGGYSQDDYGNDVRVYAISGFTVFVDINGSKGNGTLWEDVFPFYVASNGTVYPGYPLDGVKKEDSTHSNLFLGGNSAQQLPVDVYYMESTGDNRKKRVVMSNVSYARAICTIRKISKNTPYCKNLGEKFYEKAAYKDSANVEHEVELKGTEYLSNDNTQTGTKSNNPCDYESCVMTIRRKLRSF